MTQLTKLFGRIRRSPGTIIAFRDLERLLVALGFEHDRTVGSHRHYVHPDVPEVLTVQPDGKEAKRYQVRKLLAIVEEYGLGIGE
jgi:predicted RNA binding protein YcfA (HicA-like mRNA interferase family)